MSLSKAFSFVFVETTNNYSLCVCVCARFIHGLVYYLNILCNYAVTGMNGFGDMVEYMNTSFLMGAEEYKCIREEPAGMFCGMPSRGHLKGRHGGQEEIKCFSGGLPWQTLSYKMMAGIQRVLIFL